MCHNLNLFTGQINNCKTKNVTHGHFILCTDVVEKVIIIVVIWIGQCKDLGTEHTQAFAEHALKWQVTTTPSEVQKQTKWQIEWVFWANVCIQIRPISLENINLNSGNSVSQL